MSKEYRSLREALIAQLTSEPRPINEVIDAALQAHPLAGKTPRATARAQLAYLVNRDHVAVRPQRGMVALGIAETSP